MHNRRGHSGGAALPMSKWPGEAYPNEPIHGWIHRAAARNHAFSTRTFVASLGLNGKDWDYDELLQIAGQLPISFFGQLEFNTPKRCDEGYEICGQKLPFKAISKSARRVCPQCLEELRYVRNWFDFVPVSACPFHNTALVSGLPDDPLDWIRPEIGWTHNGVKLGTQHATPQIATELDRYIVENLYGSEIPPAELISGLELGPVLNASICLGRLYHSEMMHQATFENLRQLCQLGFKPLLGGIDSMVDFLRNASWLQPNYDRARFQARLQSVPSMLRSVEARKLRRCIAEALALARVRNGVTTPCGRLSRYDGEDNLLNLKGSAKKLGLSIHTLQKLLDQLSLKTNRCDRGKIHRLTLQQIEYIQNYIDISLDSIQVSRQLGCNDIDISNFVQRKLLKLDFIRNGRQYFQQSSLDDFMSGIKSRSVKNEHFEAKSINSLSEILGISLVEVVSRIVRKNEIIVVKHDLARPFFCGLEVAEATSTKRFHRSMSEPISNLRPNAQVRNAVTHAQAAARLGTNSHGLKTLISKSAISLTGDQSGKGRICMDSLNRFENRFVKACSYAPILECHPTRAMTILRSKGVCPINDGRATGAFFVDPNEVMRLTGLERPVVNGLAQWHTLQHLLAKRLQEHFVPATTRVDTSLAIAVRATSGRWSFVIEQKQTCENYTLISKFLSDRQPRRLKKIREASIDPGNIWPGATVCGADQGGFIIIDEVRVPGADGGCAATLIEKAVTRSHQLHRVL